MPTADPFQLERFLHAQDGVYSQVRAELAAGEKRTHWMWFIFPQIAGLGSSAMAQRYAIRGLEEATAYLLHPVLGHRLRECTELVLEAQGRTVEAIFGYPDNLKFHSSMTLFAQAANGTSLGSDRFRNTLERFFAGRQDSETVQRLH